MNTPLIISHRGNLHGPNSCKENSVGAIFTALNAGFDVEVDIRGYFDDRIILGHDEEVDTISLSLLADMGPVNKRIWWHAKTREALEFMIDTRLRPWRVVEVRNDYLFWNYFVHADEHYTITNQGIPWVHYINPMGYFKNGIQVLPEHCTGEKDGSVLVTPLESVYGICTDLPYDYRERFILASQAQTC